MLQQLRLNYGVGRSADTGARGDLERAWGLMTADLYREAVA